VPVDEDGVGGKRSYLSTPGGPIHNGSPGCRDTFLNRHPGASRPNNQEREILAGLTRHHCAPSNNSRKNYYIWRQQRDAYSQLPWADRL